MSAIVISSGRNFGRLPSYWQPVRTAPATSKIREDVQKHTAMRAVPSGGQLALMISCSPGALRVGAMMARLEGEIADRIAALIRSSRALSGVLALVLASTPGGELSASEMDALTDLSYKIYLDLDQLEEVWAKVSDV